MAGNLMPRTDDPPDQRRIAVRDPAEREERRLRIALGEQRQDRIGVRLDAGLERAPVGLVDDLLERPDLEPLLNIDLHTIDNGAIEDRNITRHHAKLRRRG